MTSARPTRITILAGLIISVLVGLWGTHTAYSATGLTIQPIKVSHTLNPGESASGFINLTNASDDDLIRVEVKVEDFVPTAGSTNISFVGRAEGVTTVRDWITLDVPDDFTFEEGDARKIPYTITAPETAEPGGHFGVLLFKAIKVAEGQQLKVGTQVGVLVFVTVPGSHLQKGEVKDFEVPAFLQKPPVSFKVKFENTGTVHFEPKGKIVITNMFGNEVGEVPIEGQVVLPSGVRDLTAQWNVGGLLFGKYTARLSISDGEGEEITNKTASFVVVPLWYAGGFLATVIVLYLIFRFLKRRVKFNISLK